MLIYIEFFSNRNPTDKGRYLQNIGDNNMYTEQQIIRNRFSADKSKAPANHLPVQRKSACSAGVTTSNQLNLLQSIRNNSSEFGAAAAKSNQTGLPDYLKNRLEALSGYSMDQVRVHYNSPNPAHRHALAYTQGTEIHIAPGQEQHLPHEAWHTVQQMQGRVRPNMKENGIDTNNDPALEHEADVMGEKAGQDIPLSVHNPVQLKSPACAPVQYMKERKDFDNNDLFKSYEELFQISQSILDELLGWFSNVKAFFSTNSEYWRDIIFAFRRNDENIEEIIKKTFSESSYDLNTALEAYEDLKSQDPNKVRADLKNRFETTLLDIYNYKYFNSTQKITDIQFTNRKKLTGSDESTGSGDHTDLKLVTFEKGPNKIIKDGYDLFSEQSFKDYTKLFDNIKNILLNEVEPALLNEIHSEDETDMDLVNCILSAFAYNHKNIDNIIQKSFYTESVYENGMLENAVNIYTKMLSGNNLNKDILKDLKYPIAETLSDIYYWSKKIGKRPKKIELTDSDIHNRGIGVCFVTFGNQKENSAQDETKETWVLKPEDRSLENALYGKVNSLAMAYNQLMYGGKAGSDKQGKKGIGMLNIMATPDHGSAVEFFPHDTVDKVRSRDEIDPDSLRDTVVFSSLFGLSDLHDENLVYSIPTARNEKRYLQHIDSDVAFTRPLEEENPLATMEHTQMKESNSPFPKEISETPNINYSQIYALGEDNIQNLLNRAKSLLENKKTRIILVSTAKLCQFRASAYKNDFMKQGDSYVSMIENGIKNIFQLDNTSLTKDKKDEIIENTNKEFARCRIPYWEYDLNEGAIYQVLSKPALPPQESDMAEGSDKQNELEKPMEPAASDKPNRLLIIQHNDLKLESIIDERNNIIKDYYKNHQQSENDICPFCRWLTSLI